MRNLKIITLQNRIRELLKHSVTHGVEISIWGAIFTLCFPIAVPLNGLLNKNIATDNNFFNIYAYLSDIWLIGLTIIGLTYYKKNISYLSCFFIFYLLIRLIYQPNIYSIVGTFLLIMFLVSYETVKHLSARYQTLIPSIIGSIALAAGIQSLIASHQWIFQKSLGLYVLGEPHLTKYALGIAKISLSEVYIRAYGTFPHPNVLAVFILTASLLLLSWTHNQKTSSFTWNSILVTLLNIGIGLTFSRGVIIVAVLSYTTIILHSLFFRLNKTNTFKLAVLGLIAILTTLSLNLNTTKDRFKFSGESIDYRELYNNIAWTGIEQHPLIGIGYNSTVFHLKQFSKLDLEDWEIQPVHNYFLQTWLELGFFGLVLFLLIYLKILYRTVSRVLKNKKDQEFLILGLLLSSFLFLMLIDHYFYTLRIGQWILWGSLAIISARIQSTEHS